MDEMTSSINDILKNLIRNFNTMLDCPVRFSGVHNEQKIHSFIEYIEHYKLVKCITDDLALQELQYLLTDQAHYWWLRRKKNVNTWSEALTILEKQYSRIRPPNIVYSLILKQSYEDYECKEDFIDDKLELLSELSQPELKEHNKLEMIYALLPTDLQNKLRLVNINSIKELKQQLKLEKLNNSCMAPYTENIALNPNSTSEDRVALAEVENTCVTRKELNSKDKYIPVDVSVSSGVKNNVESERDPIIKVRRTEDLMPQTIKEERENQIDHSFLTDAESDRNTISHINHNNFQIDPEIMTQINNIIDESETNMTVINDDPSTPELIKQPPINVPSLEFLGLHIEASNQSNNASNHNSIPSIVTKKIKKRCSHCRSTKHTSQACLKRANQIKLHSEKVLQTKANEKNKINNEPHIEIIQLNISNTTNNDVTNTQSTEMPLTTSVYLNQIPTASTYTDSTSAVAANAMILNISEKCINPILTTKLIAPINGKTPNKMSAAKLRSINTPSPKCHQCGTLGFYKSICPNCSPIYNNNNSHNQYCK